MRGDYKGMSATFWIVVDGTVFMSIYPNLSWLMSKENSNSMVEKDFFDLPHRRFNPNFFAASVLFHGISLRASSLRRVPILEQFLGLWDLTSRAGANPSAVLSVHGF